jgi:hypothetical protein
MMEYRVVMEFPGDYPCGWYVSPEFLQRLRAFLVGMHDQHGTGVSVVLQFFPPLHCSHSLGLMLHSDRRVIESMVAAALPQAQVSWH